MGLYLFNESKGKKCLVLEIVLIVFAVLLAVVLVVCAYILSYISRREPFKLPGWLIRSIESGMAGNDDMPDTYWEKAREKEQWLEQQNLEQIYITNQDGLKLRAQYYKSEKPCRGLILACHGCRSSGIGEFCFISEFLHNQGYDLFLVDHRACGESEGEYMGYGLYESRDTMLWIDYINRRFGKECPVILYGISMGSATVLMMSGLDLPENVKGIVADCGYTSAWNEFKYQLKTSFHMPPFPFLYFVNFLSLILAGYSFKKANPIQAVKKAKVPILFFHGEEDDFVPCYMVHELFAACTSEKQILVVPDALHAKSYQTHPELYEPKMTAFLDHVLNQ